MSHRVGELDVFYRDEGSGPGALLGHSYTAAVGNGGHSSRGFPPALQLPQA